MEEINSSTVEEIEKKCCGVYDYDGVFVPGEELMDLYIGQVCYEATNAYGDKLFKEQIEIVKEMQRLEKDRDIYSEYYKDLGRKLEDNKKKIEQHFILKDQALEETEPRFKNVINYDEIYRLANVYPGVLELLWKVYEMGIYEVLISNTHVNVEREIRAKSNLLQEFPKMTFIPVRFHLAPSKDQHGFPILDRKPEDKVARMMKILKYIDARRSTYVDNSKSVIKCAAEQHFKPFFVAKNQDPRIAIVRAANATIDSEHGGKVKRLMI